MFGIGDRFNVYCGMGSKYVDDEYHAGRYTIVEITECFYKLRRKGKKDMYVTFKNLEAGSDGSTRYIFEGDQQ